MRVRENPSELSIALMLPSSWVDGTSTDDVTLLHRKHVAQTGEVDGCGSNVR